MAKEKFIEIKGKKVFIRFSEIERSKGNIFLLHGYSFSSKNWEDINAFERFNKMGYNAYAVDYPGFGQSEDIAEFSIKRGDLKNSRYFVRVVLDELKLKKVILVGPSMGGGMSLLSSSEYPEYFSKLILVAPAWFGQINIKNIRIPKLFIWGTEDKVVPYDAVKDMVPQDGENKLVMVQGSGHPVYLEKTEEFFKIVSDFILS